jgi:hypothetical protein
MADGWSKCFDCASELFNDHVFRRQQNNGPIRPNDPIYDRIRVHSETFLYTLDRAESQSVLSGPKLERKASFLRLYITIAACSWGAFGLDEFLRLKVRSIKEKMDSLLKRNRRWLFFEGQRRWLDLF